MRRHNLPAEGEFVLPDKIIISCGKYFNKHEYQFLEACKIFNNAIDSYKQGSLVRKITDGRKILIMVENKKQHSQVLMFEFNEAHFSGLMKKYKDPIEVRRMIKNLFLIKE